MINISTETKILRCVDYATAAATDVEGDAVDTQGFGSATFIVAWGAITTGGIQSVKIQQSSDSGSSDGWSDLEGTQLVVSDAADGLLSVVEVIEPRKRYLRAYIDRATQDAVVDCGVCILANPKIAPITADASIHVTETHVSPAEGTA